MFDGAAPDQFHQFISPRTTLPLHLSFPLHASSTPSTTFLPFHHPHNVPSQSPHHFPLQPNLFHPILHPPSPTHKHQPPHKLASIHIQTDPTQLPDLTDSWTNDELLALLRIRSSMENWFPEHTWDHVSRKLAELGFKKSAEKCKEKFEDESRYFDNISNYGKNNYRFFSELEELCQNPDPSGGGGGDCDGDDGIVRSEETLHLGGDNMGHQQCDRTEDKVVVKKSKQRKRKRRDRFEMFKGFCESVVNKMMAQQEEIHNRLLEDMVKRDQEKFTREEAWKKQEMERMNKELEIMAQEQAIAGDRHATIIEFLKKCATTTSPPTQNGKHYSTDGSNLPNRSLHTQNPNTPSNEDNNNLDPTPSPKMLLNHDQTKLQAENPSSSDTLLQVPSSSNSSPTPHNPSSSLNSHNNMIPLESNSVSIRASSENSKEDVGRRWPRDEVLALINLRCTSVSNNNNEEKEGSNKGPLWERISQGMSELGYKRSAKRCKEKWENINKYFRKTKDVNKKRSLNSRTCPYFHQLSCLYGQGKIVSQSEKEGNYMSPTTNSGQMPPDDDEEVEADESSHVGFEKLMRPYQVPEMLRMPLVELCLQIKLLSFGYIKPFLLEALEPPKVEAMDSAISLLYEVGALEGDEELTPLGHHLAKLPVDVLIGKMLLYGAIFGCLSPILSIAAFLSYKSPFVYPKDEKQNVERAKLTLLNDKVDGPCNTNDIDRQSDHLLMMTAYKKWQRILTEKGTKAAQKFCNSVFLSSSVMFMIREMRMQFGTLLADIGLITLPKDYQKHGKKIGSLDNWLSDASQPFNIYVHHSSVIKAILCAGLYPNVAAGEQGIAAAALSSLKQSSSYANSHRTVWFDGRREVHIHPSSINSNSKGFQYPFLVFLEKVETNKVFLRDTSVISPYSILLFGGSINVQHQTGQVIIDGWLKLTAPAQVAVLFKELRLALHSILKELIRKPQNATGLNNEIIKSMITLLLEEGSTQQ